ncbi:MAG: AAA family ATPase, partial [Pseudomonadota bacterium]
MMNFRLAKDLERAIQEGQDIAANVDQTYSSVHILLALFTFDNNAERLLKEQGVDEETILSTMETIPTEERGEVDRLLDHSVQIARGLGEHRADSIHFLLSVCRNREAAAHRSLVKSGLGIPELRRSAMAYATGGGRRRTEMSFIGGRAQLSVGDHRPGRSHPSLPGVITEEPDKPGRKAGRGAEQDAPLAHVAPASEPGLEIDLDPKSFPFLCKLGKNLTGLAADGKLDPLIGRQRELDEICDILGKRRANNPLLIGEPGVGKTAVVEGLARLALEQPETVPALQDKIIVELDMHAVTAGTQLRGALAERLAG